VVLVVMVVEKVEKAEVVMEQVVMEIQIHILTEQKIQVGEPVHQNQKEVQE
jgi:hypothetical protein